MPIKEKAHLNGGPIPNAVVLADKPEKTTNRPKLQGRRGGRASRDKGNRAERAIVRFLQDRGFAAERVPLSGSAGGSYTGDLTVPVIGVDRVVEVKVRAKGFGQLYAWLVDRDILIVRADRSEPLVILPLRLAAEIAAKAEAGHERRS
jgi:hypothetical protein